MYYVCSDIHGLYDKYITAKSYLGKDDYLYVIGDAIDRNPDGIRILQDIMHSDNVELILGNHEVMMIEAQRHSEDCYIWISPCNGGDVTHKSFLQLPKEDQKELMNWLKHCKIYQRLTVNGQQYLLVHGSNVNQWLDQEYEIFFQSRELFIDMVVWNSLWRTGDEQANHNDFDSNEITIVGHVPVQRIRTDLKDCSIYQDGNVICIDGGCAMYENEEDGVKTALILYCLDTQEEIYI